MKTFVSLSDIHAPWHDADATTLVGAFLRDFKPDTLVLNGDIFDCPTISKYAPRRSEVVAEVPFQDQLDVGQELVNGLIEDAGGPNVHYPLGNHEDRIEKYLGTQAKALSSLRGLSNEVLFGVQGATLYEYGDGVWLNGELFAYHGNFHGVSALRKERERAGVSTITGHGHTQEVRYSTDRLRTYKSVAQGCLCGLRPPYSRIPTDWQHGFVMGYLLSGDRFRVIEVEIVHGDEEMWMVPDGQVLYSTKYGTGRVKRKALR